MSAAKPIIGSAASAPADMPFSCALFPSSGYSLATAAETAAGAVSGASSDGFVFVFMEDSDGPPAEHRVIGVVTRRRRCAPPARASSHDSVRSPRRWAAMPPTRHRAAAQEARAATGGRAAVTEDDATHCIASYTVVHACCSDRVGRCCGDSPFAKAPLDQSACVSARVGLISPFSRPQNFFMSNFS